MDKENLIVTNHAANYCAYFALNDKFIIRYDEEKAFLHSLDEPSKFKEFGLYNSKYLSIRRICSDSYSATILLNFKNINASILKNYVFDN